MRESTPCSCDPALAAALRERARIVARLRRSARAHERLARILVAFHSGGLRTEAYHEGAADALETMAARIERGDV